MSKIKVAVIGCGCIANSAHIPSYVKNDNVEILYFCDIIPERADAAVEKYGCGKAVYDYHEILNDPELDAVSVCTPNNMHAPITIDFLNAGKDVLCEKPAARTYAEALTMQATQHKTGKVLNIGVVNRFNDNVNRIKDMIDRGELGEVYQVYISFRSRRSIPGLGGQFTTKAISGGGALIDWGVHFLDLVLYCCGEPQLLTATAECFAKLGRDMPNYVYESMWAGPPKFDGVDDVEEGITGMVRTTGPTISLNGAWAENIGDGGMFIDFIGDKAGVRLQYCGEYTVYGVKDGKLFTDDTPHGQGEPYRQEIDAFVKCVGTDTHLQSHIDHNIQTSCLMQALYDSAAQHREIVLG